jgi:hypothetical protein
VLLRTIAALEVLSALVVVVLVIHGLGVVLPGSPLGALLMVVLGGAFVGATAYAGIQLWRLREVGRVSTIVVFIVLMLVSSALFLLRGQAHVIVRLLVEALGLVVLFSKAAREVCTSSPS